jgi:hypothetical protein
MPERLITRGRAGLAATLAVLFAAYLWGQELRPRLVGDTLRVTARSSSFLTGKPLESVRNGATVAIDIQLILSGEARETLARATERFVFSYDIWEERYSVVQLTARAGVTNLTLDAAQQWCLDRMGIGVGPLDRARTYRVRLEIRANEPRRRDPRDRDDPPIALGTLVDIFSRPARQTQRSWQLESAAFRLDSLK